jgi:hypothetical protein
MTKSQLRACPSCARHVRVTEPACPFCGDALSEAFQEARAPQPPALRLTRAALFAFGTGAMAVASGCSSSSTPTTDSGTVAPGDAGAEDAGQVGAADSGAPSSDAGSGFDSGGLAPVYGSPPADGGL